MAEALLAFHRGAVPDKTFLVRQAEGTEEVSGLYRFELEMFAQKDRLDASSILMSKAWLAVRRPAHLGGPAAGKPAKIHGLISSFEQMEKVGDWVRYRAVLSPRLWKLSLARHNRVFRDVKVDDLVSRLLQEAGLRPRLSISAARPVREFTVQYRESDLDFLSRWLEHEGIFTFFEQSDAEETAVFADNTAAHKPIEGASEATFEPDEAPAGVVAQKGKAEGAVTAFSLRARPLPKEVVLVDWDARQVEEVQGTAEVDGNGYGKVYEYGCHPADSSHAGLLAKARAEAIKCRGKVFTGTGRCRFFRAGATFDLKNHYRFDGKYLITRVVHRASQPVEIRGVKELPDAYGNEFQCVPSDVPYRPERVTPWPRIHGFTEALVVAGGGKGQSNMDDQGSYRLKMMYDKDDQGQPKDSHAVRMAQPYAGESFGMHFPLHVDTEVLVGHKDGDPDRPVILSAVPNPKKKSPVVGENATQCVIKTGAGNMIRMEDKGDGEDFFIFAKKEMDVRVAGDSKESVGGDKHVTVGGESVESVGKDRHVAVGKSHTEEVTEDRFITVGRKQAVSVGSGGFCLAVSGPMVEIFGKNHYEETFAAHYLKAMGVIIEATKGITIMCGGSYVHIGPAGVTIKGPMLTLDGSMSKINSGPGTPKESGQAESEIKPSKPKAPKEAAS